MNNFFTNLRAFFALQELFLFKRSTKSLHLYASLLVLMATAAVQQAKAQKIYALKSVLCLIFLTNHFIGFGQTQQQGAKLVCTGNIGGANLGNAIALSDDGNTAIVGGFRDNADKGAVWIFTRSGTTWTQQQKLIGSGSVQVTGGYVYQGGSVAISADGNTVIFGSSADNNYVGAAWVFTRSGTTWTQQGSKLVASNIIGQASQGISVSLSADGNTAMLGGHRDNNNKGAAWIFTRSGGTWTQQQKLIGTGGDASARQGRSVALSGDGNTAIMGGVDDNNYQGAVWVFTRSGNTWTQQGNKLVGTGDIDNGFGINHGTSLAISYDGNTFIDGAENDGDGDGASWIFTRSGTTWTQQGNKLVGTGAVYANQGQSVSLSADGNVAVVGGYYDNNGQGATWVYTRSSGIWTQQGNKIIGTGGSTDAGQGKGVAISGNGNTAMVGGYQDNTTGIYHGAVWVFVPAACSTPSALTLTGGGAYCSGGTGVAVGLNGSETGVTYQLSVGGTPVGSAVTGTGSAISFGNQTTAGNYTVVATRTSGGCTANMANSVTVSVNTTPTAYTVTGGGPYCYDGIGTPVGLSSSEVGVDYYLEILGAIQAGPIPGTGNPISFGNVIPSGFYTVTANLFGDCPTDMLNGVTVTLNVAPSLTNILTGGLICSGESTQIYLGAWDDNITYSLYKLPNRTTPIRSIVSNGSTVAPFFDNITDAGDYIMIGVSPEGCSTEMTGTATVNVSIRPTMFTNSGGGTYCPGGLPIEVALSGTEVGILYLLYKDGAPTGLSFTGDGNPMSFQIDEVLLGGNPEGVYQYVGFNADNCAQTMDDAAYIETSQHVPQLQTILAGGACGSSGAAISLGSSEINVNYQLSFEGNPVGSSVAGTGNAISFGNYTASGFYSILATHTSSGCTLEFDNQLTINQGTPPAAYAVTGGGTYCVNGLGKAVGLAGSELGVNYQLYNDGDVRGTAVAGTGAAFDFPNQTDFGVYTVIATNATTGCTATMTGSVTMLSGNVPPAAVAGLTTGCNTVSLTAYGGTSYAWSGGTPANTAVNTFSASGIYTVTVSTANGCSATATRAITVNPLPAAAIATVKSCNSTTLTASGGTTYSWSGGSAPTAAVNTVSVSGTYNVTVTNSNGCSATTSQVVTMPNVTEIVFGALSNCGSATLTANTIAGATYAWSGGATPNAVSNIVSTSGIYTVTITSNGCSLSTTRSVTVYPLPTPSITSANPTCNNGTSVLTATGGTAYTWSEGLATTSAVNTVNGSGTYTVTVTDNNGCSASSSMTVNAIPSPQIAGNTTGCGSVLLTAYYGNTYAWSGGGTTAAKTVTASGTYTVTATSAAGCIGTASIAVTVNTPPTAAITGSATGCSNTSLTASGGGTYQWSGGFTPTSSTNTVINATTYTVTVTGSNGCTASSTFAVTAINPPANPIITGNPNGCTSVALTASGGNSYAWSGGSSTATAANTFTASGTYTVTVTRTPGGCTATASRVVTIGGAVTPQIAVNSNATCATFTLTASGGTTYAWSGSGTGVTKSITASGTYTVTATTATCGTGTASITVSTTAPTAAIAVSPSTCGSATLTASGGGNYTWSNNIFTAANNVLNTGTYTVTVTAANGCTASSTKAVTIGNAFASISGATTACNTTTLTASGGLSYAWSGGGTTAAKTITANGVYTVTVTNSTCTATASRNVTIYTSPTVTMASSAISCGTATLTATPAPAGAYTYTWATGRNTVTVPTNVVGVGGTYNVTVTNANGCTASTNLLVTIPNVSAGIAGVTTACGSVILTAYSNGGTPTYAWSGGGSVAVKTISASGTYTVTVTAGSCTATASQTVTINPTVTPSISAALTTACNSLNLTASGGTYYAWSGGINPTSAINTAISTSTYTVTVTNSAGCTASTTQAVTINTLPTAGITGVTTACGQVLLTATGNTGSTYAWSGGASPSVAGNTFTSNGIYTVTVTQGVCGTATASRSVTINTPPTASITGNSSGVSTVTLTAAGGTYYAWNSGFTPTAAVNTAFIAGTYVVTVTDNNGCSATASTMITLTGLTAPTNSSATTAQTLDTDKLGATAGLQDFVYNNVSIYPNPISTETLTVKISVSMNEVGARIDLVDLYGKLISTQNALLKRGDNTFELDVNGLAAGIYFVKTTAAGQSFETKKVVKVGN